jgi:ribosomal protein L11 methyltransferase
MDAGADRAWGALILDVPSGLEEELCGRLAPFSLGVVVAPADPDLSRLTIYLNSTAEAAEAAVYARRVLAASGIDHPPGDFRVESIEDGRWAEHYQSLLRPFALGRRFTVLPTGTGVAARGRVALPLVPGRAFGTGEHATTQLCVEALESWVESGSRWLDIGCGTGILSIVAVHAGAGEVRAVDTDVEAIRVAEEVLVANSVRDRVDLRQGSLDAGSPGGWDGIVSNIQSSFFLAHAGRMAALLAAGGRLIASGFLLGDVAPIETAFRDAGLAVEERLPRSPWAALTARRVT